MANYGQGNIGSFNEAIAANNKRFCKFTSPADISAVDSISAYLNRTGTGSGYAVDGAIYADNSGAPGALITNSAIEISSNIARNSPNWYSVNYVTKPSLSPSTPYWLGILATKAAATYYFTGATNQEAMNADTLPFDDPFGSPTYHAHEMSVYVSYTVGGQTFYQNTGQGSISIASTNAEVATFYRIIGGASLAISSILSKLTQKTIGGASLAIASILSSTGSFFRAVGDASLAIASSVVKITSKTMGGASVSLAGALVKLATKTVGGASLTIASTLSSVRSFSQAVGGATASIAGAIATVYIKVVSVGNASVSIAGALTRASTFYRTIGAGAISISSSLTKSIFRSAGQASMAISGALVKLVGRTAGGASISIASTLAKTTLLSVGQASASIAGALTRAGTFARTVGGASLNIASSLTASLLGGVIAQAVGGATMAIAGILSTVFYDIAAVVGKRQRFPTSYDGVKTDENKGYETPKPRYKFPSSYD